MRTVGKRIHTYRTEREEKRAAAFGPLFFLTLEARYYQQDVCSKL
jgi:hypothetical protein